MKDYGSKELCIERELYYNQHGRHACTPTEAVSVGAPHRPSPANMSSLIRNVNFDKEWDVLVCSLIRNGMSMSSLIRNGMPY